jgi:hypothetical protein
MHAHAKRRCSCDLLTPLRAPRQIFLNQGPPRSHFFLADTASEITTDGRHNTLTLATADVDGDVDVDVALPVNWWGGQWKLYRNDGLGRFSVEAQQTVDGGMITHMAFADWDGDNDADLAIGTENYLHLLQNDGNGAFTATSRLAVATFRNGAMPYANPYFAFGDADGDDDLDLFATDRDGRKRLLFNDHGSFTRESSAVYDLAQVEVTMRCACGLELLLTTPLLSPALHPYDVICCFES